MSLARTVTGIAVLRNRTFSGRYRLLLSSEPIEVIREEAQKAIGKVGVRREVRIWSDPIRRRFEEDEKRREKIKKLIYVSSWDKPIFETPFELRRFRILNALSVALSKVSCRLQISGKEARNVCFTVAGYLIASQQSVRTPFSSLDPSFL